MRLVLIGTALVLAALVGVESNSKAAAGDGQHLEGSWIVRATVTGDPTVLGALITFSPNGEVVETPSTGAGISTGHGVWARTAHREFSITVRYIRRDADGQFIGTSKVRSIFRVNKGTGRG